MNLNDPDTFIEPITGSWQCVACGSCCKQIPVHPELVELEFDRGDGVCKHLGSDELCRVYESRPKACRVDRSDDPDNLARACAFANRVGIVSREKWEGLRVAS